MRTLTIDQARRYALAAQGFDRPRPEGRVDVRHLRRVLALNHVVQLDSVNVAARAHYLPFFSRLGPYDTDRLDRWLWESRENFEFWGHVASVMPMRLHPLLHFRRHPKPWPMIRRIGEEHPGYVEQVLSEVAERGPLSVSDLERAGDRGGSWWGWSIGRVALDWLFTTGALAVHRRDAQFMLHYDLYDRVIPAEVRALPTPTDADAFRDLLLLAAAAHGVGTAHDLADHWRLKVTDARRLLAELTAAGRLEEVRVEGWDDPAFLHPDATRPHRIRARALLSPFDPVVWFRDRAERLFDFHYRIEIYTPKEKRRYGYYVLPFLLDDRLAARVDLKSDRQAGTLRVLGAWLEPGAEAARTARELAAELEAFAAWQGLGSVAVSAKGDLAPELRSRL